MLRVSDGFLAALSAPQKIDVRCDVWKGGVQLYAGLPVTGGTVTVDRTQMTRRTLDLTITPRLQTGLYTDRSALPRATGDPLGFYGQEIKVYWSLHYIGGAVETIPLGVFRIDDPDGSLLDDREVTVSAVSREAFVADASFLLARTVSGPSAKSLIANLIHEVLPSVEVVDAATRDARIPPTTFEEDRWDAISQLATACAAVVYADPYGRFVIADAPTLEGKPVWTVRAGEGGVLVGASMSSSRSSIYNGVVCRGESPSSDSPPVQAVVTDDDPSSPTRWGDPGAGRFGMKPLIITAQGVTSLDQARAIATAKLAQTVGAAQTINASTVPNPALEVGDVVDIIPDPLDPVGSVRRHIVDQISIPLNAGGQFTLQTRDLRSVETGSGS
jgi:hypothetical protein